jgi:hypothetical protein
LPQSFATLNAAVPPGCHVYRGKILKNQRPTFSSETM